MDRFIALWAEAILQYAIGIGVVWFAAWVYNPEFNSNTIWFFGWLLGFLICWLSPTRR